MESCSFRGLQMEVFPEVRAIIDLSIFKDKENEALGIIKLSKAFEKCQGGVKSYEVIDSFEKIDKIHTELMKLKIGLSGTGIPKSSGAESSACSEAEMGMSSELKSTRQPGAKFPSSSHTESTRSSATESARAFGAKSTKLSGAKSLSSAHTESIRPAGKEFTRNSGAKSSGIGSEPTMSYASPNPDVVPVDRTILSYIEETCGSHLQKIERDFDALKKTTHSGNSIGVQFIQNKNKLPCHGATEKFIDLYQKIATNLTMKTVECNLSGRGITIKNVEVFLQTKFPKIWYTPKDTELTLIGNPADIKKVEAALDYNRRQENFQPNPHDAITADSNRRQPLQPECKPASNSDAMIRKPKDEDKTCPICLEEIEVRETLKCKHTFCKECIDMAFKTKSACPVCGEVYGELKGNQPEGGRMSHRNLAMHLPGYEKYDTIEIHYTIPDGLQGKEHPQPGQKYHGTTRTAYLPNSPEGRKVLKLLQRAFSQRLIFTVGTSSTTGRSNVVTWNDIHHKTSTHGGPSGFGYPDPTYLARVQDELKAKGIY
ncbi:E3 ubiquitin-protein ligase DTX3L [Pristis pectinata]|uniref:E3 ubiquitin-protein ligase DTX3L n=1 Tax=Pristis pectinata TaxID=685728 RepID=UPI00223D381F|nr:E3 ubiquitin-protein ligase DTX3L [Pristis pectinata]